MKTLSNIKLKREHGVLFALSLSLVVQVFNTASLYDTISNLQDVLKLTADCFVGVSLELGVFICIYNGYRPAGAWFALGSFFVGILFHNDWHGSIVDITLDPFSINKIYFPTEFLSSTLLQAMNSILTWFFSEVYVKLKEMRENSRTLAQVQQDLADGQQTLTNLQQKITESQQALEGMKKMKEACKREAEKAVELKNTTQQDIERMQQEIVTLRKSKAGISRHLPTE